MSVHLPVIEDLCARVHAAYVAEKRATGVVSLPSRRGTGDLMRPYEQLAEVDKADDRRTVLAVLEGLRRLPIEQVLSLLVALKDDAELVAELRRSANMVDPVPDRLPGRCVDAITAEDGQP